MASTRWLWTLGVLAFTGIVATICLWSYYLGNTYMYLYIGAQNPSRYGHVQLAGSIALLATVALLMGLCVALALTRQKSVIWTQIIIVTFFATTSLFLWVFFRRHTPQFWPSDELMPFESPEFFDSINRLYQLAVVSTVCGLISALALVGGLLSNVSVRKKSRIWIDLLAGLFLAGGLTFAYFQLLASPHHSEPDMWVSRLLSQFRLELLISFVASSLFAVVLGWIGKGISVKFLLSMGSVGFILATLGAALVQMKLNMISHKVMWDTMNQYDLRQWTYALLACVLMFAVSISVGTLANRKRP